MNVHSYYHYRWISQFEYSQIHDGSVTLQMRGIGLINMITSRQRTNLFDQYIFRELNGGENNEIAHFKQKEIFKKLSYNVNFSYVIFVF